MEKYGFVYIWYDRKHKRYYIGCRWGSVDDGYICSSPWMLQAYKRRPQDFKRRILKTDIHRKNLLDEEFKWLSLIKDEEIGIKYYNLNKFKFGHWSHDPTKNVKVSEKLKGQKRTPEQRQKMSNSQKLIMTDERKAQISLDTKRGMTEEVKKHLSSVLKGKKRTPGLKRNASCKKEETKRKMSEAAKNLPVRECPHCKKTSISNGFGRWHFDNCKELNSGYQAQESK